MKEKLTYKDFKIGQKVTCVKLSTEEHDNRDSDLWEQHLTIGKSYIIDDVDFHFPNRIAVRSDNGKITMFMPIELFSDNQYIRKLKIDKINKSNG